ncbi:MAG: hypothetical protein MRK00_13535 [Nitrosomonas sp.]|nr:hypothetical protein [Nitrosomonas sp.]
MTQNIVLESEIKCPECGFKKTETMSTDFCQWFYECEQCRTLLKPTTGDCCVFCSYGSIPCPPIQCSKNIKNRNCCNEK